MADSTGAGNNRIKLGTGDDLQIYHSGTNSFIEEVGTGDLYIRGSNNIFLQNGAGSEAYLYCTNNGAVEAYYDGSKKFETKSDGIDVQGEVQCDSLDVDGAALFDGNVSLNGAATDLSLIHI